MLDSITHGSYNVFIDGSISIREILGLKQD